MKAMFFVASSALLFSGLQKDNSFITNSVSYIASVGVSLTQGHVSTPRSSQDQGGIGAVVSTPLPFSDEIVVASGTEENSLTIQPIFPNATGSSYEYSIVPNIPRESSR